MPIATNESEELDPLTSIVFDISGLLLSMNITQITLGEDGSTYPKVLINLGLASMSSADTLDTLLQRADKNVYQAKAAVKERAVLA